MISPAVGHALDLPAVGYALVCLLLAMLLSVLFIISPDRRCSSRRPRTRADSFLLLTSGSLGVVPSLLPPASLCGSLHLPGCLVWHLQHHYVARYSCVIADSRQVLGLLGRVVYNNALC